MLKEYLELAEKRVEADLGHYSKPYSQPEDYGYDFKNWVTPYTKGANVIGGIAIILQDWTSSEAISGGVDNEIQEYGRTLELGTSKKLEHLLNKFFNLKIEDTYATNVFPFIKEGKISEHIPIGDIRKSANIFLKREIEIVKPNLILALGNLAYSGLKSIDVDFVDLPHPAARIGSIEKHEKIWSRKLQQYNL